MFYPITYDEPVFRPPAEAFSAIIQATLGCSWNKCAFCEMYTSKSFKTRKFEDVKKDIQILSHMYAGVKKVFLADGNAFVLSAGKLVSILNEINKKFGKIQRIASYALPSDILAKSETELKEIKDSGLKLLYVGIETGFDDLLKLHNKGESKQSTIEGILKAQECGIDTSVMILNGLGGKEHTKKHAVHSAEVINKVNPKFLSTLTLSFPYGINHFIKRYTNTFTPLSIKYLFYELKQFISEINAKGTIFRSDHISNQLILKGVLSKDKSKLLQLLDDSIKNTPEDMYPEPSSVL